MISFGAAVNLLNAGVGKEAGNRIFHHISIAAKELQTFVNDFVLLLCRPPFGHGRGFDIEFAFKQHLGTFVDKNTRDPSFRFGFGQFESRVLKADDRFAERMAFFCIVDRFFRSPLPWPPPLEPR